MHEQRSANHNPISCATFIITFISCGWWFGWRHNITLSETGVYIVPQVVGIHRWYLIRFHALRRDSCAQGRQIDAQIDTTAACRRVDCLERRRIARFDGSVHTLAAERSTTYTAALSDGIIRHEIHNVNANISACKRQFQFRIYMHEYLGNYSITSTWYDVSIMMWSEIKSCCFFLQNAREDFTPFNQTHFEFRYVSPFNQICNILFANLHNLCGPHASRIAHDTNKVQ